MDPIANPYSPGAGTPPPELAGRDDLRQRVRIAIERVRVGNPAKSVLMVGLRGVGKTVLLDQMRSDAEESGVHTIRLETPEDRSLPALLAPQIRLALLRLSRADAARQVAQRGLAALAGFVGALRLRFNDIEVGLDVEPEPGLADNGDLEGDLAALLEQTGRAASKAGTALILFIDELQYIQEDQFAALIAALHRCAQQRLPITMVGAGLPQLRGRAGRAKSYAERLFDFPEVGPLKQAEAFDAIAKPAQARGVAFEERALQEIFDSTEGYPYFIQEWAKQAWDHADQSPITLDDIAEASLRTVAELDESFFRVRFDRLTPLEKKYLRAMAELGAGPHRSGDIAEVLSRKVSALAPTRSSLILKGMIWSPNHGDTAFTVPLFDQFMRRAMPGVGWQDI